LACCLKCLNAMNLVFAWHVPYDDICLKYWNTHSTRTLIFIPWLKSFWFQGMREITDRAACNRTLDLKFRVWKIWNKIVACNNYDDFPHLGFIFQQSLFHYFKNYLMTKLILGKVLRIPRIGFLTSTSEISLTCVVIYWTVFSQNFALGCELHSFWFFNF